MGGVVLVEVAEVKFVTVEVIKEEFVAVKVMMKVVMVRATGWKLSQLKSSM